LLELPEGLKKKLDEAVSVLEEKDKFRLITHYDADGISAAAVLARSLMKDQKGFHATFADSFPENIPEGLPLIFTDIGNSHLKRLVDLEEEVIVLDHHDVQEKEDYQEKNDKIFVNPHEFGIDGAQEVSGGTLALLLSLRFDKTNLEDAVYGLAGAAADKQAIGGFTGLNQRLAELAVEKNELTKKEELFLDGENIRDALMKAADPYFPGISGNKNEIDDIIEDLNIDPESKLETIGRDKKRRLNSLLVLSLIKEDRPADVIESIKGTHYVSETSEIDMDRLYKLLNSCARNNKPGLGLSLCFGDRQALDEAKEIRNEYRSEMVKKLRNLGSKVETEEYDNIQYFFDDKKTRKGELAGLGMLYFLDKAKPVFGMAEGDQKIDISARATKELVKKGLDLGALCSKISKELEGVGGGHDIAAGATIDRDALESFLKRMDEETGAVLS